MTMVVTPVVKAVGHPHSRSALLALTLVLVLPLLSHAQTGFRGIPGDYCRYRKPITCCPNREDECTVPILDTLCYCDMFCDRSDGGDCCPDFEATCLGITAAPATQPPPPPVIRGDCPYRGVEYNNGERILQNCNWCSCTSTGWNCETNEPCMIQEDLLDRVQRGGFSWQAQNYTKFWGKTLADGVKYRLGTIYPEKSVENMNEVLKEVLTPPPARFDAREQWPGFIHEVRDQGNCGASWAFSTTAISADRLAILSEGKINPQSGLSPQQLLSCNQHRQRGCDGGYLDRAWWFIRKFGAVTTDCYPYESGQTNTPGLCSTPKDTYTETNVVCPSGSSETKVYKMTPPYRISTNEEEIKKEIEENGPVQATFLVHEDFYMYSGGVYQYADLAQSPANKKEGFHSVRILGWGEEGGVKYWLCANSWGTDWGENGLFKIVRGTNHCQVEAFIIGAWGKGSQKKKRKFRVRKIRKLRTN